MYMKTKSNLFILLILSLLLIPTILIAQQKSNAGNYSFKTECLGVELDGSVTVKAWGSGRNRIDAVAQAKKNAVYDVVFKGIIDGNRDCFPYPLVPEVNAEMKYEDYFNKFFSDKIGIYKEYVSMRDERLDATIFRKRLKNSGGVTYSIVIRVLRPQLKQRMIDDGILKSK